jgi:type I restriction enzyme S subunit
MSEWRTCRLGEVLTLKRGFDLPKQRRSPGRFPIVSSSGITDRHAEAIVKGPGVVIGRYGTLGKVFYLQEDFWPLNTSLYVSEFKGNDPRFVSLLLETVDVFAHSDKAAVPGVNRNHLHDAMVRVPDVRTQGQIASLFTAFDDKIDLNRRMNETLEAMARAIFKDWFVDFGPTRAKIEGRAAYLPEASWRLFPDRFDPAASMPFGWSRDSMGQHAVFSNSKRVPLSSRERALRMGSVPYYGAAGIVDHVDEHLFDGTYLLVGEDGSVANAQGYAVTQYVSGKFWVNNHAHVLQGLPPVSTEQLYLHLQHEPVAAFVTGAVQPKLSMGQLKQVPFVNAGGSISEALQAVVGPMFEKVLANQRESGALSALRDLMLPKLMSGQIEVQAAEQLMEAAL